MTDTQIAMICATVLAVALLAFLGLRMKLDHEERMYEKHRNRSKE